MCQWDSTCFWKLRARLMQGEELHNGRNMNVDELELQFNT